MVFPEGTTVGKEELLPLRPGMFHTAAQSHLPVVPIAIEYQDPGDAWVGDESFVAHFLRQFRGRRKSVAVSIGPVMHGTDGEALKERVEAWMRQEIKCLSGELNPSVVVEGVATAPEQAVR
jgi:1-acyl-sn-glycerol-3-phosphate acyltransferase